MEKASSKSGKEESSEGVKNTFYAEFRSGAEMNAVFAGESTRNLNRLGNLLHVGVVSRDNWVRFEGAPAVLQEAGKAIEQLQKLYRETGKMLRQPDVDLIFKAFSRDEQSQLQRFFSSRIAVSHGKAGVIPRTRNQLSYVEAMNESDVIFALGPAGTGKTYLAVAQAVSALLSGKQERIVLVRPAVEAGENLGFLPGKLEDKINPYLRPLYDALREMLDPQELSSLTERGMIELAPLAFMRGRTLNNSFIILDEAQNATDDQMLMFLTRLGYHSKCVIAGDPTQTDLPWRMHSGLAKAVRILTGIEGIRICRFERCDVLRHSLVERIVQAYEKDQNEKIEENS